MHIVGVDPGLNGALAVLGSDGEQAGFCAMPITGGKRPEIDGAAIATWLWHFDPINLIVVEQVHSMPKQGVASTFRFGMGYGTILGIVAANKWPLERVEPRRWKDRILAGTAKDKAAALAWTHRRFPLADLTQYNKLIKYGIADAFGLAEYGLRHVLMAPLATAI